MNDHGKTCDGCLMLTVLAERDAARAERDALHAENKVLREELARERTARALANQETRRLRDGITLLMEANKAKIPNGSWSYTGIGNTALEALLSKAGEPNE